jgi:sugar phosphate isomerase/epimerase
MPRMRRLAFSTNAFKKNTLAEAIDSITGVGYRGVEVMADVPHALPSRMTGEEMRAVRRRIEDGGAQVSNVNAFTLFACGDTYHPTWIERDAAKRQTRVDHTMKAIDLAAALGTRTVSLQPGGPLIGTGLSREHAGELYAEGLAKVVGHARACNVVLGIEPEPGLFIQDSTEYLAFKNRYFRDEPNVMMNCDIGHLFCVGEDPAEVIRQHHRHIAHVHLEDIGKNRVHQHLTPGKGAIDFGSIFRALDEVGYAGWTTVELYPYETTAAGVAKAAWEHLRSTRDTF